MYELIIHHDTGIKREGYKLIKDPDSYGHVYLELKENDDSMVYGIVSGVKLDIQNPKKTFDSYQEYIPHGKERLTLAREYESQNPNDKVLHSKTIEITEIQYLEDAVLLDDYEQYLGKKMPSEVYGLFGNNCAHFVNHVYKSMGLEGDYTRNYKTSELDQINTKLTNNYKAFFGLYPGDKSFTVFGSSIEEVAKKYNVDVSKVKKKELSQGIPDMEAALLQEASDLMSYEVLPNEQLLDHLHDSAEEEKPNLPEDKGIKINNPNQVINKQLEDLLSNPTKLQQYQRESINDAFESLKIGEQIIPGMAEYSVKSANEHYEFLQGLVGIKDPSVELKKLEQYKQKAAKAHSKMQSSARGQEQKEEDQDWLNTLISNTKNSMNDAYNDPEMQQFLQTLGNNSGFNFADNE